jgi:hypothetical protein
MEIQSIGNEIIFKGSNENSNIEIRLHDDNNTRLNNTDIVQGIFDLKYLVSISKCNKLCHTIDLYLTNDYPLILIIDVGSLGKMYVFIAPSVCDQK